MHEPFESMVERALNLAGDRSGKHAQEHLKEDNNVKQMVVAACSRIFEEAAEILVESG